MCHTTYLLTYLLVTGFPTLVSLIDFLLYIDKMINKNGDTVRTVPKGNRKIVERGNIDTPNTQIHDHSFPWLCTGVPITSGGVEIVRLAQTSPLIVKCFE